MLRAGNVVRQNQVKNAGNQDTVRMDERRERERRSKRDTKGTRMSKIQEQEGMEEMNDETDRGCKSKKGPEEKHTLYRVHNTLKEPNASDLTARERVTGSEEEVRRAPRPRSGTLIRFWSHGFPIASKLSSFNSGSGT